MQVFIISYIVYVILKGWGSLGIPGVPLGALGWSRGGPWAPLAPPTECLGRSWGSVEGPWAPVGLPRDPPGTPKGPPRVLLGCLGGRETH